MARNTLLFLMFLISKVLVAKTTCVFILCHAIFCFSDPIAEASRLSRQPKAASREGVGVGGVAKGMACGLCSAARCTTAVTNARLLGKTGDCAVIDGQKRGDALWLLKCA